MHYSPSTNNILAVYRRATGESMREGLEWYQDAHNWCRNAAGSPSRNGFYKRVTRNAGIVAALSPLNGWENNKTKAQMLISLRGRVEYGPDNSNGIGLKANVLKAQEIYFGAHPLDVLGGNKVIAFYNTILDPTDSTVSPVIDRHAFDIAVGKRTTDKDRAQMARAGEYERFANAYRIAAKESGIGSAQMQAVTWIQWRKEINE